MDSLRHSGAPAPHEGNVRDIIIFGSGGYARCVAEAADGKDWRVTAFVDRAPSAKTVLGRPVLDEADVLAAKRTAAGVVAIGDNWIRQQMAARITSAIPDFEFCRIVDPRAVVMPSAQIGAGCVVLAGSIINAAARLGEHVSIYTNAVVEHDDVLADFCSLAPGAVLGGTVTVGQRSFIGLNAGVIHHVKISDDVVVGAGSIVVADCAGGTVVGGNPARVIGTRKPGDPYL